MCADTMFIIAKHTASDPDAFIQAAGEMLDDPSAIPDEYTIRQVYPASTNEEAICLWEAESIESLQGFLDPALDGKSTQEYFEVNESIALGLPEPPRA